MDHLGLKKKNFYKFLSFSPIDIDWIATEMRPLSNETFVVFDDKVGLLVVKVQM